MELVAFVPISESAFSRVTVFVIEVCVYSCVMCDLILTSVLSVKNCV